MRSPPNPLSFGRRLPISRSAPSAASSTASRRRPRPLALGHQDQGRAVSQARKGGSASHGRARVVFVGSGKAGPWGSAAVFLSGALVVPRRLSPSGRPPIRSRASSSLIPQRFLFCPSFLLVSAFSSTSTRLCSWDAATSPSYGRSPDVTMASLGRERRLPSSP
jgi:hypothetical protein